ncbi:hypothetical protein HNQ77_001286 [Silvibacterium bohemicum]|uniref:Zinc-finger domain-containing protein n=1 Tax=Silvibacterium bohemicum TaxID=1577686 RepID=A0A841JPN6_9BACT|nr:hypothetical protein [Silvibacterium bohemicum]MBB6143342.1 hypothetical protein [Silvibacterium bohemicum]
MSAMRCKFEGEMIRAQRSGAWPAALLRHKDACADCRQALEIAPALRSDAAKLKARAELPPAMQLWAAVQRRQRVSALDRAERVVRVLKGAGLLYAVIFIAWGMRALSAHAGESMLPGLTAKTMTESIAGAGFAAVFVCSGLWYAVRRDKPQID